MCFSGRTNELQKFRLAPERMKIAELLSHRTILTRFDFSVPILVETGNRELPTDTEPKQFGGPHFTVAVILQVVVRILEVLRDVDNSNSITDLQLWSITGCPTLPAFFAGGWGF